MDVMALVVQIVLENVKVVVEVSHAVEAAIEAAIGGVDHCALHNVVIRQYSIIIK